MKDSLKTKILLALPLPPPYSGVETLTENFLKSNLKNYFNLIHVDTSNKRTNEVRGKFDISNSYMTIKNTAKITYQMIKHRPQIANIPIAKNKFGFIRDGLFIYICSFIGAKIVSRMTGDHFDKFYFQQGPIMRFFIKKVLNRIDRIIVRANRIRGQFDGLYPDEQIEFVYLPFDQDYYSDVSLVKKSSEVDGIIRILFIGHLTKAKGAFDLLEAIPKVISIDEKVKFIFAGNIFKTEYNITHIAKIRNMDSILKNSFKQYSNYIEFKGIVRGTEKKRLYKSVDLLVLPSYSESFSYVVLEAMAAGLPVVATPVGALPEVFRDRENILFVPTGEPKALAHAIVELLECKTLSTELGQRNQKAVRERFNLEVFSERMTQIFNSVLCKS